MPPAPTVSLGLVTRAPLEDVDAAHPMWEAIAELVPGWAPERWGFAEPERRDWRADPPTTDWDLGSLAAIAPRDAARIQLDRRGPEDAHGRLLVHGRLDEADPGGPAALLGRLATLLDADFGHLQVPSAEDRGAIFGAVDFGDGPRISYAPWQLRFFLPGVFWTTVLGPSYVELFGADAIASAPAEAVERVDGDRFALRLSPDLLDPLADHDALVAGREAVVDHLGRDAFWQPGYRNPIMRRGQAPRPPGRAPTFADLL
jgi:hypothetical protein